MVGRSPEVLLDTHGGKDEHQVFVLHVEHRHQGLVIARANVSEHRCFLRRQLAVGSWPLYLTRRAVLQ